MLKSSNYVLVVCDGDATPDFSKVKSTNESILVFFGWN